MSGATPPETEPLPPAVVAFCDGAGLGPIVNQAALSGGAISRTSRLTTTSGTTLVLKQSARAPAGLYQREAEGLDVIRQMSTISTPRVYAVGDGFLLMEDLGEAAPQAHYWASFGRALALQHQHRSPRFGFAHDNFLGLLPQHNAWRDDGHDFFIEHRIERYLAEPASEGALTAVDRRAIERFAQRLRELVPVQPAALLHGDLWHANMLVGSRGEPAMVDPAVYYGWPEAELSMVRQYGGPPQAFYDAYIEVNPLEPGWWERLELLFIREWLSVVAHFGAQGKVVGQIRDLVARYG